ncbi:FAST kinase domain-containing protein 3, mitochondrial [Trichoplax sp. H2]|nr:FAST kinase domain-containing protein 3, mitochondrial [Trichoplax sp. H2]|eukprot:RDD38669.1 FAST kinase domain-containing protein 3, mitochondrial [Trichoplax sp. H2]
MNQLQRIIGRIARYSYNSLPKITFNLSSIYNYDNNPRLQGHLLKWQRYYANTLLKEADNNDTNTKPNSLAPFEDIKKCKTVISVLNLFFKYQYRYGCSDVIASLDQIYANASRTSSLRIVTALPNNPKFNLLCDFAKRKAGHFNTDELLQLLKCALKIQSLIGDTLSAQLGQLSNHIILTLERRIESLTILDLLVILELKIGSRLKLKVINEQLVNMLIPIIHEGKDVQLLMRSFTVFAHYGIKSSVVGKLESWIANHFNELSIEQICDVCNAFHRLNRRCPELREMLGQRAAHLDLDGLSEEHVLSLMRSFTYRPLVVEDLFEKISNYVIKNINNMSTYSVSQIARALSSLRYYNKDLADAIGLHLTDKGALYEFSIQSIGDILYVFARWNHLPEPALLRKVISKIEYYIKSTPNMIIPPIVTSIWSLIILDTFPHRAINALFNEKIVSEIHSFGTGAIQVQMFQIDLAAKLERPELQLQGLSHSHRNHFLKPLKKFSTKGSVFQHNVQRTLEYLFDGSHYYWKEFKTAYGYSVDLAIMTDLNNVLQEPKVNVLRSKNKPTHYKRIAIEVDGPYHFLHNSTKLIGESKMKHRQLRLLGWTVVQVPYFDWEELNTDDERKQYMKRKIFGDGPMNINREN